jgi:hypothetical protein
MRGIQTAEPHDRPSPPAFATRGNRRSVPSIPWIITVPLSLSPAPEMRSMMSLRENGFRAESHNHYRITPFPAPLLPTATSTIM